MKMSNMLISTLREVPAEAEIDSHKLMLRAGMMRKMAAGVYNYMPLGLKVLKKGRRYSKRRNECCRSSRIFSISYDTSRIMARIRKMGCIWSRNVQSKR